MARCEQGQGGGRLSWDGWPATMNHECEVPVSGCGVGGLLDGGRWVATGCWGGGCGGRHSLDGAAALGGVDCCGCGNHGGIVMVMGSSSAYNFYVDLKKHQRFFLPLKVIAFHYFTKGRISVFDSFFAQNH